MILKIFYPTDTSADSPHLFFFVKVTRLGANKTLSYGLENFD